MGQFGNQPDFGTQAITINPEGDAINLATGVVINPPCALYIGNGGDLLVDVVGGNLNGDYGDNATLFINIPSGTFMPVMVSHVWYDYDGSHVTTASSIVGLR